jgi:hypothetical protein
MINSIKCPYCLTVLNLIHYNDDWCKEYCQKDCPIKYEKFYVTTSNDSIGYIKFDLKDFYVKVYLDYFDIKNQIKICHKVASREFKVDPAVFTIPRFEIDWNKLEYYNDRWKSWLIFK